MSWNWEKIQEMSDKLKSNLTREEIIKKYNNGDYVSPQYYGYTGGWTNVVRCEDCHRTGLDIDCHYGIAPCRRCGGKMFGGLIGRWSSIMVERENPKWWQSSTKKLKYWEIK